MISNSKLTNFGVTDTPIYQLSNDLLNILDKILNHECIKVTPTMFYIVSSDEIDFDICYGFKVDNRYYAIRGSNGFTSVNIDNCNSTDMIDKLDMLHYILDTTFYGIVMNNYISNENTL